MGAVVAILSMFRSRKTTLIDRLRSGTGNVITGVDIAVGADANGTDGVRDNVGADEPGKRLEDRGAVQLNNSPDGLHNFQAKGLLGDLVIMTR